MKIAKHHTDWTPERETGLKDMFAEGVSYRDISKRLGVTKSSISRKIAQMGLSRQVRHDMTPEREAEFRYLWSRNATYDSIAAKIGVSRDWVSKHRRSLNLPIRRTKAVPKISTPRAEFEWSAQDIDTATKLWRGGMSGSYIAKQIGKTRSAVVGKMARLGLSRKSPLASETNRLAGKLSHPKKVTRTSGNTRTIVVPVVPMPTFDTDTVPATARPFLDAPRGTCRWPIGERESVMLCCGPVERGSYCAGHGARAYAGFPTWSERKPAAPKPRSFADWEGAA